MGGIMKVIIYGGTGAIGSAIARKLASQGVACHLVGRNEDALRSLADEIGATGTIGDVTDESLFDRVMSDAGEGVSGLVYAVGTINLKPLSRIIPHDLLHDFSVNAMGAALAIQAAVKSLKKSPNASIVLVSSVAASQGFSMHTSMGMAKAAVSGLTLSLAAELAPAIRVNAIAPSLTRTSLTAGILQNDKMADAIANMHAMKRIGEPDDMASIACLLLSGDTGWITGQIIGVDGGRSSLRT
jgi:NAD(P)-dependent dehydrogenase (short-subunit alcohol dehydrogenase family)